MAHKIDVRTGFTVSFPGIGIVKGPKTGLIVSDATYEMLNPDAFHASDATKPLVDQGFLDASGDAVIQQAVFVADMAAMTSTDTTATNAGATYTSAEQTLINELKTDHNALRAEVITLRALVNNTLAAFRGTGKPMASS